MPSIPEEVAAAAVDVFGLVAVEALAGAVVGRHVQTRSTAALLQSDAGLPSSCCSTDIQTRHDVIKFFRDAAR
jgi:hypothetical protein